MTVASCIAKCVHSIAHGTMNVPAALQGSGVSPVAQFSPLDLGSRLKGFYIFDPAYSFTDAGKTTRTDPDAAIYTVAGLANSVDAVQATSGQRPSMLHSNGYFYGRYVGASKGSVFSSAIAHSLPMYVYVAVKSEGNGSIANLLGRDITGAPPYSPAPSFFTGPMSVYWGETLRSSSISLTVGAYNIARFRIAANQIGFRIDNGTEENISHSETQLTSWIDIGDPNSYGIPLNHDIAKLVIVHGAVTTEEDANIMAYMAAHTDSGSISGDDWFALHPLPARYTNPRVVFFVHGSGVDENYLNTYFAHTPVVAQLRLNGYMVVSANFGGEHWGNAAGLAKFSALKDYIVTNYAPSRMMFWAESMGGALGHKAIVQHDDIVGMYTQYPVCDLESMGGGFDGLIASAYPGGTTGESAIDLAGTLFTGKRLRYTHSASDTVVTKAANTDAMRTIVGPYATESGLVVTTGDHGDASNYDAADMLSFFNRCR